MSAPHIVPHRLLGPHLRIFLILFMLPLERSVLIELFWGTFEKKIFDRPIEK